MEKNMVSEKNFTSKALVIKALFAAVLCVSAYISIPLPTGAHITFLNFIVLLIALVFPWQDSLVITLLWLVLGAIGVPVFIGGNAGIGYLLSGWAGTAFLYHRCGTSSIDSRQEIQPSDLYDLIACRSCCN